MSLFHKPIKVFIDFDKTICPNGDESIPPSKDCIATLRMLQKRGDMIVIYSVRSNIKETGLINGNKNMIEYLDYHQVPYDAIDTTKPHFHLLIDDRAFGVPKDSKGNVDWTILRTKI